MMVKLLGGVGCNCRLQLWPFRCQAPVLIGDKDALSITRPYPRDQVLCIPRAPLSITNSIGAWFSWCRVPISLQVVRVEVSIKIPLYHHVRGNIRD